MLEDASGMSNRRAEERIPPQSPSDGHCSLKGLSINQQRFEVSGRRGGRIDGPLSTGGVWLAGIVVVQHGSSVVMWKRKHSSLIMAREQST
ncbi:hypothetical protein EYF80_026497 [Liparis tanakae]|uniref:Uncharacterized protein n=1 Tax=Liparis tanakae TaxID=230148 RepID=A0A4Z2HBW0_9TELE|nr:hypothetical protein EYF80_026497 [Liparis tanakae]